VVAAGPSLPSRAAAAKRSRGVRVFLAVAYAWTWTCWAVAYALARRADWLLPASDRVGEALAGWARDGFDGPRHLVAVGIFTAAVYGPVLGAKIALMVESGPRAPLPLLRRTLHLGRDPTLLAWVVGLAVAVTWLPAWAGTVLFGADGGRSMSWSGGGVALLGWFLIVVAHQLLTSGLGEEPGWRGYLMPRLQQRLTGERWVWVLGAAWWAWHLPVLAVILGPTLPEGVAPAIVTLAVALGGNYLSLVAMSYLYGWLYQRSGSLLIVMLFHALTNALPMLAVASAHPTAVLLVGAFPWVIVLAFKRALGEAFPGRLVPADAAATGA
jgi:membrane protease YdiL (CAAX protease family)